MSNELITCVSSDGTVSNILESIKCSANWLGRQIATGWTNYLVPAVVTAWAALMTGYGVAAIAATLALVLAYKIVRSVDPTNDYGSLQRIIGIVALMGLGATIALALPIAGASVI